VSRSSAEGAATVRIRPVNIDDSRDALFSLQKMRFFETVVRQWFQGILMF
jgi:hypothetical protein